MSSESNPRFEGEMLEEMRRMFRSLGIESYDKERVYDTQIYPLMRQIEDICKEHRLPFLFTLIYSVAPETGECAVSTCMAEPGTYGPFFSMLAQALKNLRQMTGTPCGTGGTPSIEPSLLRDIMSIGESDE